MPRGDTTPLEDIEHTLNTGTATSSQHTESPNIDDALDLDEDPFDLAEELGEDVEPFN